MVEYEVSLDVEAGIAAEFRAWLHAHVRAMLALPGFVDARMLVVREPLPPGRAGFCVRYRLVDAQALASYLAEHAATMRAEGLARFGDRMQASRRVLADPGEDPHPLPSTAAGP